MNKPAIRRAMRAALQGCALLMLLATVSLSTSNAQTVSYATSKVDANPTLGSSDVQLSDLVNLSTTNVAGRVAQAGKAMTLDNTGSASAIKARHLQGVYYHKFASSLLRGNDIAAAFRSEIGLLREVIPQTSGLPASFTLQSVEQDLAALIVQ